MNFSGRIIGIIAIATVVSFVGCGCKAPQTNAGNPAPPTTAVSQTEKSPSLPEWAPKNPSPEFLRAAKVLKPLPPEFVEAISNPGITDKIKELSQRILFPACYEFFGTLTDEQIKEFTAQQEIRFWVKSLSPVQRKALEDWFEAFHKTTEGGPPEIQDYKVLLYKWGAREDFSNVQVGFSTNHEQDKSKSHVVGVYFWIREHPNLNINNAFAQY